MACITKRRGRWVIDFYDQHGKRRWKTLKAGTTKKQARDELRDIEDKLRVTFGTKVKCIQRKDGSGEIVLEYYSRDELERLIELIEIINKNYN